MTTLRSARLRAWRDGEPSASDSQTEEAFHISSQTFPPSSGVRRSGRPRQAPSIRHASTSRSTRSKRDTTINTTPRVSQSHARTLSRGEASSVLDSGRASLARRRPNVRSSLTGNQLDVMTVQERARYVASVAADCLQQMVGAELEGQDRRRWAAVWRSLVAIRQAYIFPTYAPPFPTLSDLIHSFDPQIQSSFDFAALGRANGVSSLATFVYTIICPEEAGDLLLEVESSEDDLIPTPATRKGKAREINPDVRMAVKRRNRMLYLAWKKFWLVVVPLNLRSHEAALRLWLDFATQIYLRFDCLHVDHAAPTRGLPPRPENLSDLFSASAISRHGQWGAGPTATSRTETEERKVVQARWKLLARRRQKELLNDSRAAQKFTYSSFRQNMLAFIESEILSDIVDSPVKPPMPLASDSEPSSLEDTDFENRPLGGRLNARHDILSSASDTVSDPGTGGTEASSAEGNADDNAGAMDAHFDPDIFADIAAEMEAEERATTPRASRVVGLGLESEDESGWHVREARSSASRQLNTWSRASSSAFAFRRRQSDAQQIAWESPAQSRENTPRIRFDEAMRRDIAQMTTPRKIRDPSKTPRAHQHLPLPVSILRQSFPSPRSDSRLPKGSDHAARRSVSRNSLPPPEARSSSLHIEDTYELDIQDGFDDLLPSTQDLAGFGMSRVVLTPARQPPPNLLPSTQDLYAVDGSKRPGATSQHATKPSHAELSFPSIQSLVDDFGQQHSRVHTDVLPDTQDLPREFGNPHSTSTETSMLQPEPPSTGPIISESNVHPPAPRPRKRKHSGTNKGPEDPFVDQPGTAPPAGPPIISASSKTRDVRITHVQDFASPDSAEDREDRALIRTPTTPNLPSAQVDLSGTRPEDETMMSVRRTPRDLLALPSPARSRPPLQPVAPMPPLTAIHPLPPASRAPSRPIARHPPQPTARLPAEDPYLIDSDSSPLDPDPNFVIPRNHVARPSRIHGRVDGHFSSYCRISGKRKWTRDEELLLYRTVQKVPMSEEYPLKVVWYLYGEHGVVSHTLEQFNPQHMKDKMRVIVNRRINNQQPVVGRARYWLPTWHEGKAEYLQEAEEFKQRERMMKRDEDDTESESEGESNVLQGHGAPEDVSRGDIGETSARQARGRPQKHPERDNVVVEIPVRRKAKTVGPPTSPHAREKRPITRQASRQAPPPPSRSPSPLRRHLRSRPVQTAVSSPSARKRGSAQRPATSAVEVVQRAKRSAPLPKRKHRVQAATKASGSARRLRSSATRSPVIAPNVDSGSASPEGQVDGLLEQIEEEYENAELDRLNTDEEGEPEIDSQEDYTRVRQEVIKQRVINDDE